VYNGDREQLISSDTYDFEMIKAVVQCSTYESSLAHTPSLDIHEALFQVLKYGRKQDTGNLKKL
jgi:hypothetical protein